MKNNDCCKKCDDELYGGEPCALEHAFKSIENKRAFVKKALKPAEDAAKELEKATATEKVRLQGTKETKVPNLKPYTETVHVKDRKELSALIESAKKENKLWKVERSRKEGYRYVFVTKVLKEEKLPKGATLKKDAGNVPLNVAHFNQGFGGAASGSGEGACCGEGLEDDKKELESEIDLDVAPVEDIPEVDEVEEKPELTMEGVFTKYFDMHGNDDHSITVCLKGCMDKEDCPCITTEPLEDKEYELLKGEFHEEEPKEEVIEESKEDDDKFPNPEKNKLVDTYKGVDIYDCTCGKFVAMIDGKKVKKETIDELKKCIDGKCESLNEGYYPVTYHVKADRLDSFVRRHLSLSAEEALKLNGSEEAWFTIEKQNDGTYIIDFVESSLRWSDENREKDQADLVNSVNSSIESDKENKEELNEASSAETRAFKHGGQDFVDLLVGRTIARIKDKKDRDAAVASVKAGRKDVTKMFTGERKDIQAQKAIQKKFSKMSAAGVQDESLVENKELVEETKVSDNVEIRLDDLELFKPIAGAKDTWKLIIENDKLKDFANILGDFAKDGKMTTSDLNDLLWFEKDWVFDKLDINPFVKSGDDVLDAEIIDSKEVDK